MFSYSKVLDCFKNEVDLFKLLQLKELVKLYKIIEKLKDDYGYGYRRISKFLIENGFKSARSNKDILLNYVYSIYKKGKI